MRQFSSATYLLFALISLNLSAQPAKPNAVDIYQQIEKLNFLGSVMYIAAHPDDENTRLISYFSNHVNARTSYLSLTRGDGGQNLIGPELREMLGVIRTQELIGARKIDGGEQFFTRANDFGYSKNPDETLNIWNKDQVRPAMVLPIRRFRPDIIINRFDSRTPGSTHGHHTASAMLSLEASDLAGNPEKYSDQLANVKTWSPKRNFFNTSWWFYGSREKFEKADKSKLYNVETGVYFPSFGKSNQEIAALSRSSHRSQGFGTTGTRGGETEFIELVRGDAPSDRKNLFDGIDTSWSRVRGGKEIGDKISLILREYDFKNPSQSVNELLTVYRMIQKLEDKHWKTIKSAAVRDIIAAACGLYLEAVAQTPDATPGSKITVSTEAINRSNIKMTLESVETFPRSENYVEKADLAYNLAENDSFEIVLPETLNYSEPYWLRQKSDNGMYRVDDVSLIGTPENRRDVKAVFNIRIDDVILSFERHVVYKYNDDAKGEMYEPFDIVPDVSLSFADRVTVFTQSKRSKKISVRVRSAKESVSGTLKLEIPSEWKSMPASIPFSIQRKGEEQTFEFEVTAPSGVSEATVKVLAQIGNRTFDKEKVEIRYDHIPKQLVLLPAEARFLKPDLRIRDENIAYIMGAGDEVDKAIIQMGYPLIHLQPEQITKEKLAEFDVVVCGVRTYNKVSEMAVKQPLLLDFVSNGKTLIVQYNTLDELTSKDLSPYSLKISRDRVTDENAEVRFLAPNHKILNSPNKITSKDFEGWKQEIGLYFPNQWDPAFTPILSANDKGEDPKNGALLVAKYGKGHYIYTGLSFFRQLPEGVTGAFRLLANMISIGN